jgi:predicted metalloprotease
MRLDDFDPNDVDVEDQRGSGGGFGGLPGGLPFGIGGGGIGCGTILIVAVASLVFGVNPLSLLSGGQGTQIAQQESPGGFQPSAPPADQPGSGTGTGPARACRVNAASKEACNALSSLNKTWAPIFAASNVRFGKPRLVFYSQSGRSGCGAAQSAMGPFYCPEDNGIYLDTDFFQQMDQQLGATGQFARDYVIAHEYGHHIQNLLGLSDKVHRAQEQNPGSANALSVRLELQADCYAGVWAAKNKDRLEAGDMESGLNAAHQIGDDTLTGGRAPESSFTHGTSAQRMQWLRRGMESGNEDACDTFGQGSG